MENKNPVAYVCNLKFRKKVIYAYDYDLFISKILHGYIGGRCMFICYILGHFTRVGQLKLGKD